MDDIPSQITALFSAKEQRRQDLAALSWPDKVRVVVKLQEAAAPLLKGRNPRACVWDIEGGKA